MADPGPLISTRQVQRLFVSPAETVRAVDGVDFEASAGEFVCLFGHSGSGKTTLLNLLAGLDLPTAGSVMVAGHDLASISVDDRIRLRRQELGVVHQAHLLINEFTAAENVALPMEANGVATATAIDEAEKLLTSVGLHGHGARYPSELSGGQQQRVGIARALSGGRRVLLADEPTGSLDSRNAAAIFTLLASLAEAGTLVIVASHDPNCQRYATRSVEMLDGQVVGQVVGQISGKAFGETVAP
ncbi:MAG TPA: ABC transporter ATP-binding protein [Nocardioides sp.]|uniref:ABC transporter ATP-binding protein n=1 Tax=uncultured Nocardioides sp. TaxID=198441 RepID=UPI0026105688|nr:ABC transporter ATP-binding protein [uncultured Nocardioides sp.]HRD60245.1 ABC transporter ATP-binding protein [Nocardioides sp.]HRI96236.1 ABC transporter ATP-binding protein [Nocardioides sp.]HRK44960.1 ABC transporter ATP-binding protein [Nocardioides sp.]